MVPFKISDESVRQLKALISRTPEARPEHGIRIYISGLSNGGPEWSLTLDTYSPDADECCDFDGLKVMIERDVLEAVGGIDVQYESFDEDDEAGGFLITALDPEVQALYGGGCSGNCGSCHGGCHGCHGSCHSCDGECDDCNDGCCHCHDDNE